MYIKQCIIIILAISFINIGVAQQDTLKKQKLILNCTIGSLYIGSYLYLNQAWYKPYATSHFHFFNDNPEWLQMDKCGHFFTAYYLNYFLNDLYLSAGYSKKKSRLISSGIALSYMTGIEIMDGFSSGWGFSWGDEAANLLDVSFIYINYLLQDPITIKFSFYPSNYYAKNPVLLGSGLPETLIKDYNAQTYWVSFSPFFKWKKNMEWLCLSLGYGADGMIGARDNYVRKNNTTTQDYTNIPRYRQYYLSLDIDLRKINTRKKWLRKVFNCINWIKIPAPTIELKGKNIYYHPLLFSN